MNNYLVTLRLYIGAYEKHSHLLINAETEEAAQVQALRNETHNDSDREDIDEDEWWDDYMVYRVDACTQLSDEEYALFRKFM